MKIKKKMQAGGVAGKSPKAPMVDPNGAYTKVQERTLGNMKKGGALKKQAAVAIAMKKAGKAPKKMMQYGGEAASMVPPMKMGGNVAKDGKWIQKAIKKPGALRKSLGAKKGEPIPAGKLAAAAKKPGKLGQRARLAQTLKKMKKK
jgi:hypothetical protein